MKRKNDPLAPIFFFGTVLFCLLAANVLAPFTSESGIASAQSTLTLGNPAVGTISDTGDSGHMNAFRFTMPGQAGKVVSMSVYLPAPVSPAPNNLYQLAIYSDAGGSPGVVIAVSAARPARANSWNTVPVSASLSANASYWLVYNSNGASAAQNNLSFSPGGLFVWKTQNFGTWPVSFGRQNGSSGNTASIYATLSSDSTPPSIPAGLTATAVSQTRIDLAWSAATDDSGVIGYRIFRDGAQVGTSATTSYQDAGLAPSTRYSYTISAVDPSGNDSGQSAAVSATTWAPPDTTPPSVPSNLTAAPVSASRIDLSWTPSADETGVAGYRIYRNGAEAGTSPTASYPDSGLAASTTYHYTVSAFDAAGNHSALSAAASGTTQAASDTQAPAVPAGLSATPAGATRIDLAWNASADNVGTTGYTIYRDGMQIAASAGTSYQDTGLNPSTVYRYTVSASDAAGNASAESTPVSAATPAAPTLTLGNTAIGSTIDTGDSNYMNAFRFTMGSQAGRVTSLSVYIAAPVSGPPNDLFQVAIYSDSGGNPGALMASSGSQAATPNSWNTVPVAASLSANTAYWLVYNSNGASTAYNNLSLSPGGTFIWKAQAFGNWPADFGGQSGGSTNTASIYATLSPASSPSDTTPPSVPAGLTATPMSPSQINLAWTASTDQVGVAGYQIFRNGSQVGTASAPSYSDAGLSPSTPYVYTVAAFDAAGNVSGRSSSVSVSTPSDDNLPGPMISNLNVTAITANTALVTWTTDEASDSQVEYGLNSAYGSATALDGASVTAHSVQLTGLSADTLYHFQTASRNASLNRTVSGDATFTTSAASPGTINGRDVLTDPNRRILSWRTPQETSYSRTIGSNVQYLLNDIPTDPGNGLKLYYTHPYFYLGSMAPADWPHNPAGLFAMFVDSALAYYSYSGETGYIELAKAALDHHLAHGMTSSSPAWSWAGVPYASSGSGSAEYTGASYGDSSGEGDGTGVIEPDKVGELGHGFLKMYQFSGEARYLNAAVRAADMLAGHVRAGDAAHSPWPFRVYAATNVVREEYTANVIGPIKLFDELIRLNLGNVAGYRTARLTAWNWLMSYPMQNNVWANYFEDFPIQSDLSNVNQYVPLETARYLLLHPESDPDWRTHVPQILHWVEATFGRPQFGANAIGEQARYNVLMGSHTSRYASVNAMWYEKTGDPIAKEKAFRAFNWATYMTRADGSTATGVGDAAATSWFSDSFGDFVRNFMAGLGAVPEWTPPLENHLVRSTSVVLNVSYLPAGIDYRTFDAASTEVLHLSFTPTRITANGSDLPRRTDLAQPGWTFDPSSGILRVFHQNGAEVTIR